MTREHDFIRLVEAYLDEYEGTTPLPDAARNAIRAELPTTQQRPAWWPARRFPTMNNAAKYGVAAAVLAVAALLGFNALTAPNTGSRGIDDADATPSPTVAPEARDLPQNGTLEAGTYRVSSARFTPVTAEFEVPSGWVANDLGDIVKNADSSSEVGMAFYLVTHVYEDACESEGTLREIGPSPEDLVAALLEQRNTETSEAADVTLGGYAAKRIDIAYPPDLDTEQCRHPGELIQIWADEAETNFFALVADHSASVYAVDVEGERVVIVTQSGPEAAEADIAEREAIVESVRFSTEP